MTEEEIIARALDAVGRTGGYFFCMSPDAVNQGLKTAEHILTTNQPL